MRTKIQRAPWLASALLLAGCDRTSFEAICFELAEVRRFGHPEVDIADLDQRSVAAAAGVLGDIRGVVVDPKDAVFVLDRAWQKIVAFRSDGSVERVILGGEGNGPGEFRLPIDMTGTESGISILDYGSRRITRFDWMGNLERTTALSAAPAPFRHVTVGDSVWVTPGGGSASQNPMARLFGRDGDLLVASPSLLDEDQPFGLGVGVTRRAAGEIPLNTARPGVWMAHEQGSWSRLGDPLFPDDEPPIEVQVAERLTQVTPAQHTAIGIGAMGDSLVLQGVSALPEDFRENPPRSDAIGYSLAVFRSSGQHLATLPLATGIDPAWMATDSASGRIFLRASTPYPQVVEFQLVQCESL